MRQPVLKDPVRFNTKPRGPFFCCIGPRVGMECVPGDVSYKTLGEAIDVLAREALPPTPEQMIGVVCDRYGIVVVGWHEDQWLGLECGYEALRKLDVMDPGDLLLAEIEARATAP